MDGAYDENFEKIYKEIGHAVPFLDAFFGFLSRRTDFFHPVDGPLAPPGAIESIVLDTFRRWEKKAAPSDITFSEDDIPVLEECEVGSEIPSPDKRPILKAISRKKITTTEKTMEEASAMVDEDSEMTDINTTPNAVCSSDEVSSHQSSTADAVNVLSKLDQDSNSIPETSTDVNADDKIAISSSDCYNGAVRNGYRWSQSITDLDVQVTVGAHVQKGNRDVRVKLTSCSLRVEALDSDSKWMTLVEGELSRAINKEESIWTLVPGKYVQIHLEKSKDCWWDALLKSEPKIDLRHIDATRAMEDLSEEEHMKIEELMWNEERKRRGLPTSDEMGISNILKEAWDKEGSPFKGQPFDPSVLNFANGSCTVQPKSN